MSVVHKFSENQDQFQWEDVEGSCLVDSCHDILIESVLSQYKTAENEEQKRDSENAIHSWFCEKDKGRYLDAWWCFYLQ